MIGLMKGLSALYAGWRDKDFLARQIGIILDAVTEELEEESHLFDNPTGRLWIINFSKLMEWTVTGDMSQLPDELIPIACQIEGIPVPAQSTPLIAIEDAH